MGRERAPVRKAGVRGLTPLATGRWADCRISQIRPTHLPGVLGFVYGPSRVGTTFGDRATYAERGHTRGIKINRFQKFPIVYSSMFGPCESYSPAVKPTQKLGLGRCPHSTFFPPLRRSRNPKKQSLCCMTLKTKGGTCHMSQRGRRLCAPPLRRPRAVTGDGARRPKLCAVRSGSLKP